MFRLLVIYRGMWCPHYKAQLLELEALHDSFVNAGTHPVAVSADTRTRSEVTQRGYELNRLKIGCDMPLEAARDLGVYISAGINERKMPHFCEPASFLIDTENRIQAVWIASNAFARTSMQGVRDYIDFLNDHPDRAPRGSAG